ncbi:MAG TPA: aspartate ammonia-lyase, partial [Candidatus Kapabacteria bacterium]|nr:aspartate ammonia-lyase [Candidatus Kapabacteria bacterium]
MAATFRIEHDSLGDKQVPANAYYGVQTQRAVENYPISGWREHRIFVDAFVILKKCAALTNKELKVLPAKKADAIVKACNEILGGKLREQFVVDVFQAGAGTSHNMNVNEVISNRAAELLGGKKGDYKIVNPNDDVNMSQSTNDTFPTSIRLASIAAIQELLPSLEMLQKALAKKAKDWDKIIKSGRTHLEDATPIRLGQEFGGYAEAVKKHITRISATTKELGELGIGGTAVGTGLNAHPKYRTVIVKHLRKETGFDLRPTTNYFEAMQSMAPFVILSSALKNFALDLIRIANDLRLLNSGPTTGLKEITLPAVQPGSSIMPGKVNPSMAEMMNMVCFQVVGNDTAVAMASQAGQLELNVMMPLIAFDLLFSMEILKNAVRMFTEKCVSGIVADAKRCEDYAHKSASVVTALNPIIGYAKAAEIAKEAVAKNKTVREVVLEKKVLTPQQFDRAVQLMKLTEP